jgi:ADP-heptose:LPS heptosyltransferase
MNPPRSLIYRALGLGDLLTAVPALRGLRRALPEHHLVMATGAALTPLALHVGAVDEVLACEALQPLAWEGQAPEIAVNLHGRGPQSHRVVQATRPRRLIAFRHSAVPESADGPRWREAEHDVDRWCRLLSESGIPSDPADLDIELPVDAAPAARGATLIHPGAASAARRWPPWRWAAVARFEHERGRRVVITGGRDEVALAEDVASRAGLSPTSVYAGRTSVMQLAALVAAAGRVVCGDTGVAHLATALGTPSVVLFSTTSPDRWGPPLSRPQHRVLWAGTTGDPHGSTVHEGLLLLNVDAALAALHELESAAPSRGQFAQKASAQ